MSDNNRPESQVPVPHIAEAELAQREGYYYPDYADYTLGQPAEGTDWSRIGKLLWYRKWWILATVLVGTLAGWGVSQFAAPEYETFTKIWIQDQRSGSGPIQAQEILQGEGWADVFRSRAVLRPVVEELHLQLDLLEPEGLDRAVFAGFVTRRDVIPGVYTISGQGDGTWTLARDGEATIQRGRAGQPVGEPAGFEWLPAAELLSAANDIRFSVSSTRGAVSGLASNLVVNYNRNSNIIQATLTWTDPQESATILNALGREFVRLATDLKAQKIREEREMLEEQTQYTQERLQSAEFALESHRVETITLPSEPLVTGIPTGAMGTPGGRGAAQSDPVFGVFSQRKIQADQLSYDLAQVRDLQRDLEQTGEPNVLAIRMIPSAVNSAELNSAIQQLQQKLIDRQTLLYTYTPEYPAVVQLDTEINDLRSIIIPGALRALGTQVESQLDLLNQQIVAQSEDLRQIPRRTIENARLQREMTHAETLHDMLLLRLKEAQLAEATSAPGIEVLDPAWAPTSPLGDTASRIIMLFSMASLGLGIAGVLVLDHLDKRIRHPEQVTGSLGLPVLGVVPRLQAAPDPNSATAAIAVESFRGLRTQIAHVDGHIEGITLVTSPAPREGKSMVSANLAISYATAGYKTLLLDGDTRRGRAQEMFGLKRSPGLTDYLMGRSALEQVLQETNVQNLMLLARGAPGGFNADLLESERMDGLLAQLRETYEVIIIDGPPLAAGADVLMLGERSRKVVIVLRAGSTREDLARAKLETLGNVQLPIVGAVLNAMPKSAPYYDYYVHYYYADAEVAS